MFKNNQIIISIMSAPETNQQRRSNIEFILLEGEENVSECTLVGGYFGLGRVGYLSINHLIENLDVRLIGYINSDFIPPFVSMYSEKMRAPFELWRHKNLIILATHFEPYKYEQRSFAEALVKFAKSNNLSSIIQIGGLDKRYQPDPEFNATVVVSNSYDQENKGPKIPVMDEGLYVTGPAALVMLYSQYFSMASILLLPYAERSRPDPKAAAIAISTINDLIGIDCDVEALIDEGQSIEIEEQGAREIAEKESMLEGKSDSGMFV